MARPLSAPALAALTGVVACAVALAGCERQPPAAEPAGAPRPRAATSGPSGPAPFDARGVVFEPAQPEEPPESVVQIPPRPAPAPAPAPTVAPPPPPASRGPSGSCDVRASEGFCFAFTGDGWTPGAARAQCDAAPEAEFGPGTCPLEDRVATCAFERPSAPGREIVYVYYEPYEPALAELACPGTFTRLE